MKLKNRSYPHPVLGNQDDVPGAAFQSTFEFSSDGELYYFTVTIVCSSTTINKLITNGSAHFVLHIECSNTMCRRVFRFTELKRQFSIPASQLNDAVEVNAFVCCAKDIPNYSIEKAHADYGKATFSVTTGDVLAVGEARLFYAETRDSLRRIGSIMEVVESTESADHEMRTIWYSDKIQIVLCKSDYKTYGKLKSSPALASQLGTTLVLPVLMQALQNVKESPDEFEAYKWYHNLTRRIEEAGIDPEQEVLIKAQKLLQMPIHRALAACDSDASGII